MMLGLKDKQLIYVFGGFFCLFFLFKGASKSDKHGSWFESDLGTKHVVENHLLGFTEAENQFASYKGGCYLWCAYLLPVSVHHSCGLLVKDIILFNEI